MEDPKLFNGYSLKRLAQGAALGAVLTMVVGFNMFGFGFGWYSAGGATKLADTTASSAVVKALTPICAAAFKASATPEQMAELKSSPSYTRTGLVRNVVQLPGIPTMDYALGSSCAEAVAAAEAKSAQKQ